MGLERGAREEVSWGGGWEELGKGLAGLGFQNFKDCFKPRLTFLNTEYDRAKVPPYNGNDPRPPLVV